MNQQFGQGLRRQLAVFLQPIASRLGQTFDTCLYRDATGCTEEIEHLAAPQVDPRLYPKVHGALRHGFKQVAPRKKDLINEVDICNPSGDQSVELGQYCVKRAPPVSVAKILLRAKGAVVWAPARSFDLRTHTDRRRVEPVVM